MFSFLSSLQIFFQSVVLVYIPTNSIREFLFPASSPTPVVCGVANDGYNSLFQRWMNPEGITQAHQPFFLKKSLYSYYLFHLKCTPTVEQILFMDNKAFALWAV
jgi:hypothetical protein